MNFRIGSLTLFLLFLSFTNLVAFQSESEPSDSLAVIANEILLERITVTGSPVWRTSIPGAASYISSGQLLLQSYSDIHRVLRSVSGVNIQEEDGFGLRPNIGMRGAGVERSTKVNIMEDGVLASPAPYSAPAAYYFPNTARIHSVEVRKGSSQIKYGPNTTGGAINLLSTPIPSNFSANAEVSGGQFSSGKLYTSLGNSSSRFGWLLEGLRMNNEGFKQLDGSGDTGFLIRDVIGKFMVRSDGDAAVFQRLEFKAGYNDQVSDETYLGLTREDFRTTPLRRYAGSQADRITTEHLQFSARHFALFSNSVDLTTTLYHNTFSRNWYKLQSVNGQSMSAVLRNPSENPEAMGFLNGSLNSPDNSLIVRANDRNYYSRGAESVLGIRFEAGRLGNQAELGVRFHQDQEDRFQLEDGYRMQNGLMQLSNPGVPGTQDNRIGSATALSVFLKNKMTWHEFTFSPGIRIENIWFRNENFGRSDPERSGSNLNITEYEIFEFIPGFGLTFKATDHLTLISGIHKGFSPPSPGSPAETRSEKSINYEVGGRFQNDIFHTELIGFYNDYSNMLGSDLAAGGGSGTTAQFNAGSVRVFGVEFSAGTDFADYLQQTAFSLPFSVNYTYTDASFRNSFRSTFGPWGNVTKGDMMPYIPEHQLNVQLGYHQNKLSVQLNSSYMPAMRTVAGSGSLVSEFSTDSYFVTDLSSSYQLLPDYSLFINIRNLFNETYVVSDRPAGLRPGLPRMAIAGIRFAI
ncbi:MAG: TonB-dependent receptor [Balneolaceae bacterium]|nr:MAG: TonB-dependent receptor [Balneolaceae bacterium]